MDEIEKYRLLVNKHLTKPTHIAYIQKYIFKCDNLTVQELLSKFVDEGLVEPHSKFKDYYGKR